jgi:hypothetical protein
VVTATNNVREWVVGQVTVRTTMGGSVGTPKLQGHAAEAANKVEGWGCWDDAVETRSKVWQGGGGCSRRGRRGRVIPLSRVEFHISVVLTGSLA